MALLAIVMMAYIIIVIGGAFLIWLLYHVIFTDW